MFYPEEMTEIELIVPAKDLLAVTKALGEQAIFQQSDSSYLTGESELAQPKEWQDKASAYATLERRIQTTMQALELAEGKPSKNGFDSPADINSVQAVVEQLEGEVRKTSDALSNETKHSEFLESMLRQLQPVADMDIDLSKLHGSHSLFSVIGTMPVENMDRLQTSLSRIPFVFLPLHQEDKEAVVWLAGSNANSDILKRAVASSYLNPMVLPEDVKGKPAEIIASLQDQISCSKSKIDELKRTLVSLREAHTQRLQRLLWEIRSSRMLTDAIVRYGRLKYTYLIVGWAIASKIPQLQERLKKASNEILIETFPIKRTDVKQNIPVALKNPKGFGSFQDLVTTYARPRYDELDPTFLIAITFPLLFGAMFGDVAHGLMLALLGVLLLSKKVKALRSLASLGGLVTICGLVATAFGFIYGSIFGIETILPAIWIHPMENILTILGTAVGAGIFLLTVGFIVNIFNAAMSRNWGRLIFDKNGLVGLVFYWSLLGFAAGAFISNFPIPKTVLIVAAAVSAFCIMFAEIFKHLVEGHRPLIEDGIGTYGIQAFFELFEAVIGMLSNTLSYVRLGAFAVAHAGLSSVIFIVGNLINPGHGVFYWIVVVFGNIGLVLFEGLIVGIQTMRLEYYEFFSKFYSGGGSNFEPLKLSASDKGVN